MKIWEVWIRLPNSKKPIAKRIPATDMFSAIVLLEKKFGKGCVLGPPIEVK